MENEETRTTYTHKCTNLIHTLTLVPPLSWSLPYLWLTVYLISQVHKSVTDTVNKIVLNYKRSRLALYSSPEMENAINLQRRIMFLSKGVKLNQLSNDGERRSSFTGPKKVKLFAYRLWNFKYSTGPMRFFPSYQSWLKNRCLSRRTRNEYTSLGAKSVVDQME